MEKKPVYTPKVKEAPILVEKELPILSPTAQMPALPYLPPQPQIYDTIPAPMPFYQDCCVPMYPPCPVPVMNPCCLPMMYDPCCLPVQVPMMYDPCCYPMQMPMSMPMSMSMPMHDPCCQPMMFPY